jgi:hypothetical protein
MSIAESIYLLSTFEEQTDEVRGLIRLIGDSEDPSDKTDRAEARLSELGKNFDEVAHLVNQYHISIGFYDHQ